MKRIVRPNTPKPTTLIPITEPPVKATFNAGAKPSLAALVVLLFAFVATFIPKKPANPDAIAPTINESDIKMLESDLPELATPKRTATAKTKIASIRYSALRNAIAPSAMLVPIDFILSVPSSWLFIQLVFQKANNIAMIPEKVAKYKKLSTNYSFYL